MEQNKTDKIILPKDDEAARFVENISGWVSRDGLFYGKDERTARYQGSTHSECADCGSVTSKGRLFCTTCADNRDIARHEEREKSEWNEEGMLYSHWADKYFCSWGEVFDYAEDMEIVPQKMQLVICEPVPLRRIDEDYWSDDLPEDGELPKNVQEALDYLNEEISKAEPVSFVPGKVAAVVRQAD